MEDVITVFIGLFGIYLLLGVLFGIYFFIKGAARIDPLITDSKWTVRLLLFPGTIGLWPFLLKKLLKKK